MNAGPDKDWQRMLDDAYTSPEKFSKWDGREDHRVKRKMLKTLRTQCTDLDTLPDLGELESLEDLSIQWGEFKKLPDSICNLKYLKKLKIDGCPKLKSLPEQIGSIKTLEFIWVANCGLESIPESLTTLPKLKTLWLYGNKISSFPTTISLPSLQALTLSHNPIGKVPNAIKATESLRTLRLAGCNILEIPEWLARMPELVEMNLTINLITEIPRSIGKAKKLTELKLCDNLLSSVPVEIAELKNLEQLDLQHNKLTELPIEVWQLIRKQPIRICRTLYYVGKNFIEFVPEASGFSEEEVKSILNLKLKSYETGTNKESKRKQLLLERSEKAEKQQVSAPTETPQKPKETSLLEIMKTKLATFCTNNLLEPAELIQTPPEELPELSQQITIFNTEKLYSFCMALESNLSFRQEAAEIVFNLDIAGIDFQGQAPASLAYLKNLRTLNIATNPQCTGLAAEIFQLPLLHKIFVDDLPQSTVNSIFHNVRPGSKTIVETLQAPPSPPLSASKQRTEKTNTSPQMEIPHSLERARQAAMQKLGVKKSKHPQIHVPAKTLHKLLATPKALPKLGQQVSILSTEELDIFCLALECDFSFRKTAAEIVLNLDIAGIDFQGKAPASLAYLTNLRILNIAANPRCTGLAAEIFQLPLLHKIFVDDLPQNTINLICHNVRPGSKTNVLKLQAPPSPRLSAREQEVTRWIENRDVKVRNRKQQKTSLLQTLREAEQRATSEPAQPNDYDNDLSNDRYSLCDDYDSGSDFGRLSDRENVPLLGNGK